MIHHQIFTWIPLIVVIPFLVFACEKEDLAYPKQPKFAQLPSEILQQDFALSNAFVGIKATQDAHDLVKDFSKDLAKESGDNLFFLKQFSAYFSSFLVQKELDQNEINGNAENRDAENRDTENRDTENRDTENRDAENRDAEISSDSVLSKDSQISDLGIKSSNLGSSNLGQSLSLDQSLDLKIISENKQIPIIQHYQVKPEDFEVAYDFSDHLNDAYVERNAMIIAPNMPGWTYQIEQTEGNGLNSSWQPPTFAHQHYISWLQGLGATLKFHVSAEMAKQSLNTILIWVESVGTNQKLSIFLDRNHLTNLSLKGKAQFYKIQLNQSLTAGEHQIRFWFKFAKNIDQKNIKNIKSPGAIGPIFINPKDEPIDLPNKWQNQTERLIFAGPPQQYSFYTIIPKDAILKFKPKVNAFRTITFEVNIENDQSKHILYQQEIQAGEQSEVLIPLAQYGNQAFKINFKTYTNFENASKIEDFEKSSWVNPQLIKEKKQEQSLSKVQHLLIWQIEGLRWDLLYAALFHTQFHLPHLHELFKSSLQSYDCWNQPIAEILKSPNFEQTLKSNQILSLWLDEQGESHAEDELENGLEEKFNENLNEEKAVSHSSNPSSEINDQPITSIRSEKQLKLLKKYQQHKYDHLTEIFRSLDWLVQNRNQSTLSFLSTSSFKLATQEQEELTLLPFLSLNRSVKAEDLNVYERQWLHYLLILKKIDYQLGVLRSTLSRSNLDQQTAILVLGGGAYPMKFKDQEKIALKSQASLDLLYTPIMLYHPNLKLGNAVFLRGIEMQDVVKLLGQSLGISSHQGEKMDLGEWFQFQTNQNTIQIIDRFPTQQSSMINHQLYQRLGQMLLKKTAQEELLWNLEIDPFALKPMSSASPLMMRTMRHMIKNK